MPLGVVYGVNADGLAPEGLVVFNRNGFVVWDIGEGFDVDVICCCWDESFNWSDKWEVSSAELCVISNEEVESRLVVSRNSLSIIFVDELSWTLKSKKFFFLDCMFCFSSHSVDCSSNDFVKTGLLDGVIVIGMELFHWTSPNCISSGLIENWIVGCIETGSWGIDDGVRRLVNDGTGLFFRLLSNVNDWDVPPMNSYSSVDEDVVGVISSFVFDEEMISVGLDIDFVLFIGFVRDE